MHKVSVLMFVLVVLLYASPSSAALSYTVRKGDTLCEISRQFDVPVSKIKRANGMKSDRLAEGRKLIIPVCSSGTKQAEEETAKGMLRNTGADTEQKHVYYVVRPRDTMTKVARRYSLSEDELREMNNLGTGEITVGQRLLVSREEPKSYTVKRGDSIAKIARKARVDVAEIRGINDLHGDSLKPGQKLLLERKAHEPEQQREHVADMRPLEKKQSDQHTVSPKPEELRDPSPYQDISELGLKERVILFAKKMLHLPYRFGGTGIFGVDCSAYVQKVFGAVGVMLPRSAREQFTVGEEIEREELSAGDLVFFRTYAPFPSHVGIYLGNNLFIHASSKSKEVTIDSLETPYYFKRFIGARRLVQDDMETASIGQ